MEWWHEDFERLKAEKTKYKSLYLLTCELYQEACQDAQALKKENARLRSLIKIQADLLGLKLERVNEDREG